MRHDSDSCGAVGCDVSSVCAVVPVSEEVEVSRPKPTVKVSSNELWAGEVRPGLMVK